MVENKLVRVNSATSNLEHVLIVINCKLYVSVPYSKTVFLPFLPGVIIY